MKADKELLQGAEGAAYRQGYHIVCKRVSSPGYTGLHITADMPRFWNMGICLMTLLINGLTSTSQTTLPNTDDPTANPTDISTSTTRRGSWCPAGTLPPNTTNYNNRICPVDRECNNSMPCLPGYVEDKNYECVDIHECSKQNHSCGFYANCRNTVGSYYCKCDDGYHKDNQTEFCPSKDRRENACKDIDECSNFTGICGSNSICTNTPGSYECVCKDGFKNISNTCVVQCKNNASTPCQDNSFQCSLQKLVAKFTPDCNATGQDNFSMEKLLEGLDELIDGFRSENKTDKLQKVGSLLRTLERTVKNLALLEQKTVLHDNKKETIRIHVTSGTSESGALTLQGKKSQVTLDSKTAAGHTRVALLGCLEYTNISHLLGEADYLEEESKNISVKVKLVSPVVSVFLGISNTSSLQQPVSVRLSFTEKVESRNTSCVFWSVADNSWSSKGCVMVDRDANGITCNCTHLTSFAVLMLLHDYESWTLDLITKIGLSISIFCLVLAIITFCFCRSLHGTRNTIHTHLCISLFLGNCIFLLGINAHNKVLCGIVAGLLHGFYLCSFCWMALEGLELYLMLVSVFNTHLKKRYLLAVGYGTPALIITISAAVYHQGYGTKTYCWLSRDRGFIWAFMGPVCAIVLVNCGIFVLTVWKLAEKMSSVSPEQGKLKRIRTLTVTSLAQLCILGSCWAFGFFMFSGASPFFVYAFTILNTLQGLQIFCLHCLMHKKVRADYKKWICALAHFKSPVYSEFSNTSNTQTNTKGKPGKESGL